MMPNLDRDQTKKKQSHEPSGYWKDWGEMRCLMEAAIAEPFYDKQGKRIKPSFGFPTVSQLRDVGFQWLYRHIQSHHDGIVTVRRKMNQGILRVERGHWDVWENLESEIKKETGKEYKSKNGTTFKKIGEFPKWRQLRSVGRSDLVQAMAHYGGINAVRKKMGRQIANFEPGYWKVWENYESEMKNEIARVYKDNDGIFKRAGEFPSARQLLRANKSGLGSATDKYYGGFPAVRARMGYTADTNESFNSAVLSAMKQFVKEVEA